MARAATRCRLCPSRMSTTNATKRRAVFNERCRSLFSDRLFTIQPLLCRFQLAWCSPLLRPGIREAAERLRSYRRRANRSTRWSRPTAKASTSPSGITRGFDRTAPPTHAAEWRFSFLQPQAATHRRPIRNAPTAFRRRCGRLPSGAHGPLSGASETSPQLQSHAGRRAPIVRTSPAR